MRGWRLRLFGHRRAYADRRPCTPAIGSRRGVVSIGADVGTRRTAKVPRRGPIPLEGDDLSDPRERFMTSVTFVIHAAAGAKPIRINQRRNDGVMIDRRGPPSTGTIRRQPVRCTGPVAAGGLFAKPRLRRSRRLGAVSVPRAADAER